MKKQTKCIIFCALLVFLVTGCGKKDLAETKSKSDFYEYGEAEQADTLIQQKPLDEVQTIEQSQETESEDVNPEAEIAEGVIWDVDLIDTHLAYAEASSTLEQTETKFYGIYNLFDFDGKTCWCEGAKGCGIGESLHFEFDKEVWVWKIDIANGYFASQDLYDANGRVTMAQFSFSDGSSIEQELYGNIFRGVDVSVYSDSIQLEHPVKTSSVTLTIVDAVAGTKYDDVCISDIDFWGKE